MLAVAAPAIPVMVTVSAREDEARGGMAGLRAHFAVWFLETCGIA